MYNNYNGMKKYNGIMVQTVWYNGGTMVFWYGIMVDNGNMVWYNDG